MTGMVSLTKVVLLAVGVLGLPVMASAQMAVEYYHLDAIGSVLVVTDNAHAVVEQHDYDVFGQELNAQAGSQPKRFTGKERDQETDWDYFGARYYGSKVGRFTTVDLSTLGRRTLLIHSAGTGTHTPGTTRSATWTRMANKSPRRYDSSGSRSRGSQTSARWLSVGR